MIRLAREDELDTVAIFIAHEQSRPASRNAFFGDSAGEVSALLESWETPWAETSAVGERNGRLSGFLGAELDNSLRRAWLHGPVVADTDWDEIADALLAVLRDEVPRVIDTDQELAGDVANERLAAFAARHGFVAGAVHHALELPAVAVSRLPSPSVPPVEEAYETAFIRLHDELFPGTYYSGPQLLELAARDEATVLGLVEDDQLAGYATGRIDEAGDGYVDFVGVTPDRRQRGHGATLVAAMSHALSAHASIAKVSLTVSSENAAALALYDRLGFTRASSVVGYRRAAGQQG